MIAMKRFSIALMMMILASGVGFSQQGEAPLAKGEMQLNFGQGMYYNAYFPLYVGMDFAVQDDITIGGQYGMDVTFDWMSMTFRGDYHFNRIIGIPKDFDFYAGGGVGINFGLGGIYTIGIGNGHVGPVLETHVGGRWFWSDKWGMNAEFMAGSFFGSSFGLTMKF